MEAINELKSVKAIEEKLFFEAFSSIFLIVKLLFKIE